MFKPAIQQTRVLVGMALFSLLVFYGASAIHVEKRAPAYKTKIRAAERMAAAMTYLKEQRMAEAVFVDDVNDPNETALVGSQFSQITTDEGDLDAKISVLDPNVAAMIVDFLTRAGVEPGDTVAVAVTGSMPGGNLAVYCALEELQAVPRIISSVGASQWGANSAEFTWLDMERMLAEAGFIHFRSLAASLGGGGDIGRRLSPQGRAILREAIARNGIQTLQGKDLDEAIQFRLDLYEQDLPLERYSAFINVGGGAAVLGDAFTPRLIDPGLTQHLNIESLRSKGVLAQFGRAGVPVIHVLNIHRMFDQFAYPYAATPTPAIGTGRFYASQIYSPWATGLALLLLVGVLVTVGLNSKRKIRNYLEDHEPESYV